MPTKLLITGGCGFIGTNIALHALEKKYKVIILDSLIRKSTEDNAKILEKKGAFIIRGDVRNMEDFDRVGKIDAIIHLAANPGIPWSIKWPLYDFKINTLGTINALEHARTNGNIPLIFASTNKIYTEEVNDIPVKAKGKRYFWNFAKVNKKNVRQTVLEGISEKGINENFPMDSSGAYPHSPYGASKASSDLYCQEYFHIYNLPTVINRMSCIYGLYQKGVEDQGWVDWFVRAKIQDLPLNIYGDGKQVRDALFGGDVAELYIKELEQINKVKGQVFNVGGGIDNTISLLESIDYLNKKGGKKLKLKYHEWRPADQKVYITDITKVKKTLNWKPKVGIYEGIDSIYNNYQKKM